MTLADSVVRNMETKRHLPTTSAISVKNLTGLIDIARK